MPRQAPLVAAIWAWAERGQLVGQHGQGAGLDPDAAVAAELHDQALTAGDQRAYAAGLGEGYSGHNCRVGMAVDLMEAGATMPQLQAVGRWKSSQTMARYVGAQFAGRSIVA